MAVHTDLPADLVWIVDLTPADCPRPRPTAKRSNREGWAGHSYRPSAACACAPTGLPITWALTDPELHERQVLVAVYDH